MASDKSSVEQHEQYAQGKIFRVEEWSEWLRVSDPEEEFSGGEPPSENFLAPLQLMLEGCDPSVCFDIVGNPESCAVVRLELTKDHPVSLAKVIGDITYWPIGTGISLFCDADGHCCAYIRGQDSAIARYYQI